MFTFSGMKSKFAVAAVVAAGAMAVPAVASAVTPPPPLQTGDTQAFASLTAGGPRITTPITRTFRGTLTLSLGAFQLVCTNATFGVTMNANGTTLVESVTFPVCTTNVSGCNALVTATGLGWGNRIVTDSASVPRDRINVGPAPGSGVVLAVSGPCPVPTGSYVFSGVISPSTTGGNPASVTFSVSSGSLLNPALGLLAVTGVLSGTSGEPLFVVM